MKSSRRAGGNVGFTLVELLVSMVVLLIMVVLVTQLINSLRVVISHTTSSIDAFKEARDAFETITRRVAQATLNSYDDANPTAGGTKAYVRASELRFISGDAGTLIAGNTYPSSEYPTDAVFFQAPLGFSVTQNAGLTQLLNTCGYYIKWDSDKNLRPSFLPPSIGLRYRFRLMEVLEPSENLRIYSNGSAGTSGPSTAPGHTNRSASWDYTLRDWFQYPILTESPAPVHVLAENIIFLAVLPMVAPQNATSPKNGAPDGTSTDIAPAYLYDTAPNLSANPPPYAQNQLPPMVNIMMIAVDEPSFARYQTSNGTTTPANLGLGGILTDATYAQRQLDVAKVTKALTDAKIGYRVFSIAIPLSAH